MQGSDAPDLGTIARVLDGIGVALCLFDERDRTMLWNATFLEFFPEHADRIHVGEDYRQNLYRFYRTRLSAEELPHIDRHVDDGIARHRAQTRPFAFSHRGRSLRVASLPLPHGGRLRVWTAQPDAARLAGSASLDPARAAPGLAGRLQLADLFANLADGAIVLDPAGLIVAANDEFLALYDAQRLADVLGRSFAEVVRRAWDRAAETDAAASDRITAFIDNARFAGAAFEVELPGERWRRVIERRMTDGTAYLSHADISVLKQQQRALAEAGRQARDGEERFRLLTENSGDVIVSLGHDGRMHFVSPAVSRVLGWDPRDVTGAPLELLISPEDLARFDGSMLGGERRELNTGGERRELITGGERRELITGGERRELITGGKRREAAQTPSVLTCRFRHRNGGWIWMEAQVRPVTASISQPIRAICSLRDVTARVAAETALQEAYRQLATLAVTDPLTGIANRRRFEEVLLQQGAKPETERPALSLLLIDVDHFKRVNDMFGHQSGDRCLQMVAQTIQSNVQRESDLVARFGGEEFAVVLPGTSSQGALRVADAIRAGIEAERGDDFNRAEAITVSIGVVSIGSGVVDRTGFDAIVTAADRALYRAKREGRNRVAVA